MVKLPGEWEGREILEVEGPLAIAGLRGSESPVAIAAGIREPATVFLDKGTSDISRKEIAGGVALRRKPNLEGCWLGFRI